MLYSIIAERSVERHVQCRQQQHLHDQASIVGVVKHSMDLPTQ